MQVKQILKNDSKIKSILDMHKWEMGKLTIENKDIIIKKISSSEYWLLNKTNNKSFITKNIYKFFK